MGTMGGSAVHSRLPRRAALGTPIVGLSIPLLMKTTSSLSSKSPALRGSSTLLDCPGLFS